MNDSLVILGRQPSLGMAELESLYGAENVVPVGANAALLHIAPCSIDFARLGGSLRLCKMLTELDTTNWKQIEKFLVQTSPSHAEKMPAGKMHLGLSVYGIDISPQQLLATGLSIKKAIQRTGRSVRLVPNKSSELNTAQVIHNKLTSPNGWELIFVRNGNKTLLAQTVYVQDIDRYSERDYGRPKRDARVGMLPPKLAQIIINLATGPGEFVAIESQLSNDALCMPPEDVDKMHAARATVTILDPFCGTGVILQEGLLMGYRTYGTDLEPRMVEYSRANLEWLRTKYASATNAVVLDTADATAATWAEPIDMVAAETYLGRPFTSAPAAEILAQTAAECNLILKKFLHNIHPQLTPGTRLCLAVPAWQTGKNIFKHLPLVDQVEELGYNHVRFEHVRDADLLYYRPDQIVARELLVITRK